MKRILIFSTAFFPFVGGAEVATKELADRIDNFEFDLVTARMSRKLPVFERIGNINVYRVGFGFFGFDKFILPLAGYLKARKLNKKNHYSLIWSIMASQASVAASFFKKNQPQIKLLLTLQEGDEEGYLKRYVFGNKFLFNFLIKPWHLLVFKKSDYITAISRDLKNRAEKNNVSCPVEIIPNGVDLEVFLKNYPEAELDELKNKLGKKINDKFIIHTGRSVLKNALGDIIRSLEFLPENFKFLALGGGQEDGSLKQLAKDLKVSNRVLFLDFVGHGEMVKHLKVSDVFVRPSLSEGLGNSFLEAMAAGIPVIGTSVGGIPDFLIDGETGLFCKVRDPQNIAQKVLSLLENNDLRQKIVANARKLVAEEYNWRIIAPKMENIFNKLISQK